MAKESLTEYVTKLLRLGYSAGTIRTTLMKAGYSPTEINNAISCAQKPKRQISLNLKVILIGAIVAALITTAIILAVILIKPEPKTINIRTTQITTQAAPGETASFLIELTSNTDKKEQATLTYQLQQAKTQQTVQTKQETTEIRKQRSITAQIKIPSDISPGQYTIKSTLQYSQGTKQDSTNIQIVQKEKQLPKRPAEEIFEEETAQEITCPESCDDFNPCTIDRCEKGLCIHQPIQPCCGNGICEEGETLLNCAEDCAETRQTPQEIITQANTVAKTDPEAAALLCNKLTRQEDKDLCFSEVAQTSGKSIICTNINAQDTQDSCLMEFALEGEYTVCDKIKNSYLSKSCNTLKRSSTILEQAQQLSQEPE